MRGSKKNWRLTRLREPVQQPWAPPVDMGSLPTVSGDEPPKISALLRERMLTYRPHGPKITQQELADAADVSRHSINELLNDKRNLTAEMAVRLERVFGGDPNARWWLHAQGARDLWEASKIKVYVRPL